MLSVVFDDDFKALGRERKKTKGNEGAQNGLKRIQTAIRESLEDAKVDVSEIKGIGIGCPGPLDIKEGVLKEAPNLGWYDLPLKKELEKEFKCPVVVSNDVDAGVYGEYRFGAAQNAHCAVGIFPGTGVGGGCVYRGEIFQSVSGTCMEIGHIPIISDGPVDGCGLKGCLEACASRLYIASQAAAAAYRGQAPYLLKNVGTDVADIRSGKIADAIKAGDEAVERVVKEAAHYIGLATVTIVHLLAPEIVVLGGGLVEAIPDIFVENVEKSARKHALPSYRNSFKVVAAKLGDDATAKGVAAWAQKKIQADTKS